MCLKQKKGCNECAKVILLLADDSFCFSNLKKTLLAKKLLCNIIIFFVAKCMNLFMRPHKKIFAFFLCVLHKMIFAVGKYWFLRFSLLQKSSKSKHTLFRNLNVDRLFALPTKAYLQQATNHNRFSQKSFCAAAQKCFGYLHDGIVADSKMFFGAGANNH